MSAAACIFLHIRDLCRGVCVLNRSNNSLFMVRQSVFEHEGSMHITCLLVLYLCLKIGSQGNLAADKLRSNYADSEKAIASQRGGVALVTTYTCYYSRLVPRGTPRVCIKGSK